MDVQKALELVWHASARSSQAMVAKEMKVPASAISRWKPREVDGVLVPGDEPRGALRVKLFDWAEKQPSPPDVLTAAVQSTGENLVRLSKISGYAEAVLDMMRGVTQQQERVVDSLRPWVTHEAEQEAIAETIRQTAKAHAQTPPTDTEPEHPSTARAGRRKAALRGDGASEGESSDQEKER